MEIIIVILLIIIALKLKNIKKPITQKHFEKTQKKPFNNYYVFERKTLMNDDEKMFYRHLRKLIKNEYMIFPQVPLSNFIKCKYDWCYENKENPENTIYNKINRKTVDYIITDYNFNLITVVELDGSSHNLENRIERDNFVDKVMQTTKINIVHINKYNKWETEIKEKLPNLINEDNI